MLGLFLFVALLGRKLESRLRENVTLIVLFHLNTPEEGILQMKTNLEAKPEVKEVLYTTSEQGMEDMARDLGQDIISTLGYNPIPATLEIYLKAEHARQSTLSTLKQELGTNETVREVSYQTGILEQIETNARKLLIGISVLAIIFSLISFALINSTIRLDLYSKRFIIRSMQLVGATRWFIVKPFVGKAFRMGLYASLLSLPVLAGIGYILVLIVPDLLPVMHWLDMLFIAGIIMVTGIVLTMICSYFASRKYLKLKLEELY